MALLQAARDPTTIEGWVHPETGGGGASSEEIEVLILHAQFNQGFAQFNRSTHYVAALKPQSFSLSLLHTLNSFLGSQERKWKTFRTRR